MSRACRPKGNLPNSKSPEESPSMVVEVRLFASFREGRFKNKELELPEGSSLGDLLAQLEIARKDAKITIVNGSAVSAEHKLAENDVIAIFPPIAGG